MADIEKVAKVLEDALHAKENYPWAKAEMSFEFIEMLLELLKEQETTSTGETRIFQCEKCGYGIDDIFLSNEHDFDVYPHYCPNCGREVKWE